MAQIQQQQEPEQGDTIEWGPFRVNVPRRQRPQHQFVVRRPQTSNTANQHTGTMMERPAQYYVQQIIRPSRSNSHHRVEELQESPSQRPASIRTIRLDNTTSPRKESAQHIEAKPAEQKEEAEPKHQEPEPFRLTPREIITLERLKIEKTSWRDISDEMGHSIPHLRSIWHEIRPELGNHASAADHPLSPKQVSQLYKLASSGMDWWDISDEMEAPVDLLRMVWRCMRPVDGNGKPIAIGSVKFGDQKGEQTQSSQKKGGDQKTNADKKEPEKGAGNRGDAQSAALELSAPEVLKLHQLKTQHKSWKEITSEMSKSQEVLKKAWKEMEAVSKEMSEAVKAQKNEKKKEEEEEKSNQKSQPGKPEMAERQERPEKLEKPERHVTFVPNKKASKRSGLSDRDKSILQDLVDQTAEGMWSRIACDFYESTGTWLGPRDIEKMFVR